MKKGLSRTRSKRPNRILRNEPDMITSLKEANQERKNEKLQQTDINKEIEDSKRDVEDVREFQREEMMKKKLEKLLMQLPHEDRLRNLIDEDREQVNKNNFNTVLKTKK